MLFVKDTVLPNVTSGNLLNLPRMTSETRPEINNSEDDLIEVGNDDENSIDTIYQGTPGPVSSNEFLTLVAKKKNVRNDRLRTRTLILIYK